MKRFLAFLIALAIGLPAIAVEPVHVIDVQNYKAVMAAGVASDHGTGYIPSPLTLKAKFADSFQVIPRSQWKDLVAQGKGTFLSDLIKAAKIPPKNQDGLGYCWVYASVSCVETLRAVQGQPMVTLSPESVGGPINGWRNRGGNGLDALAQLTKVGCCANAFMDAPNSLSPGRWKAGWEDDCGKHKITVSWASVESFDEVFTAVLLRMPVSIGLNWWGHQVIVTDPYVFSDGSYGVVFRNSWGNDWPNKGDGGWSTLTEGKAQPDGSFAAVNVDINDVHIGKPVNMLKARQALVSKRITTLKAQPKK